MLKPPEASAEAHINRLTLVTNWFAEFRQGVASAGQN
jgi:hypothetical protein